ncbi:MAG: hypothetical protein KGO82_00085 [Bacteroidota bacterium]|nr:hypothetical protein [Bacteroidota bacterium]
MSISTNLRFLLIGALCFTIAAFRPVERPAAKVYVKNIMIIYKKPAGTGDGPTLRMRFLNGTNKSQTYTMKGNIPLLQLECEKPDGSIIGIRGLQEDMTCSFSLTLPPGQKDLIISEIGVTGAGWTMRINNGPEIPIVQGLTERKM